MTSDWRADVLRAVHDVFTRDLQAVHADLRTYALLHSGDGSDVLDALERTISTQVPTLTQECIVTVFILREEIFWFSSLENC